jgi:hypothetical protein
VLVEALGLPGHQQQVAVAQHEFSLACRVVAAAQQERRAAPRLSEAITGAGPSSGSSSLCQPM